MSKTDGEKREYQRGYNRGRARSWNWIDKLAKIARGYRARLADHDTSRVCRTCQRWTRGCDTCIWGRCATDFNRPTEPAMWPDAGGDIITTEGFGCVNWLPVSRERG